MINLPTMQDITPKASGMFMCGGNRAIHGLTETQAFRYPNEYQNGEMVSGYSYARDLISKGKIFSILNMHHLSGKCDGFAFPYGHGWHCGKCNNNFTHDDWWIVKVMKDGNCWFIHGFDFVNLQDSSNYAFGETKDEAISNYANLFSGGAI